MVTNSQKRAIKKKKFKVTFVVDRSIPRFVDKRSRTFKSRSGAEKFAMRLTERSGIDESEIKIKEE